MVNYIIAFIEMCKVVCALVTYLGYAEIDHRRGFCARTLSPYVSLSVCDSVKYMGEIHLI